jgi:transcriptional regulator with XRE-family HTH domain
MVKEPINQVLASNLRYFMQGSDYKTQQALAARCGMAQRTIGNYLNPKLRLTGSKGKEPSANLAQLQSIAEALGVEVWQLLRPMTATQRVVYRKIEEAFAEVLALGAAASDGSAVHLHEPVKRYQA